jgi:hypothetical protein
MSASAPSKQYRTACCLGLIVAAVDIVLAVDCVDIVFPTSPSDPACLVVVAAVVIIPEGIVSMKPGDTPAKA